MMKLGVLCSLMLFTLLVGSVLGGCGPTKGTAEWYVDQANKLYNQGRYDEAIEEYSNAIELDPSLAMAYFGRGLAYKLQGRKPEALADFEKFITLTDNPQWIEEARHLIDELQNQ